MFSNPKMVILVILARPKFLHSLREKKNETYNNFTFSTGALQQHFYVNIRNGPPEGTVEEISEFLQKASPLSIHKMPPQPNADATSFVVELLGQEISQ